MIHSLAQTGGDPPPHERSDPPHERSDPPQPLIHSIREYVMQGMRRANGVLPLALCLLMVNILFALALTIPMYGLLDESLSLSLMGDRSVKLPDVSWLSMFLSSNKVVLDILRSVVLWTAIGYMGLNTFLMAGALEVIHAKDRFSFRRFFSGIISHGPAFLRLWLVSLTAYFVLLLVLNKGLASGLGHLTEDWATEAGTFILFSLKNVLVGTMLLLTVMVFDYARILLVLTRSRRAFSGLVLALRFVKDHWRLTVGVFGALGLIGAGLTLADWGLGALLIPDTLWLVILGFLIQQAFMFSRMWLRVVFYGAQMEVFKQNG